MTAVAASLAATAPDPPAPSVHVTDAGRDVLRLEQDKKSLLVRLARFQESIQRLLAAIPSRIVGVETIDGATLMFYSTGAIRRLTLVAVGGESPTGMEWRWEPISPAPDSPAAIVAEALRADAVRAEMAVVTGDES